MSFELTIFAVPNIPEIKAGDHLAQIILSAAKKHGISLEDQDILVIAQKIVSKAEGCVYDAEKIQASQFAKQMSRYTNHPPEYMELVLQSSKRIVRMAQGMVISQTHHGLVMANAGVDASNAGGENRYVALPSDPDKSAADIKKELENSTGKRLGVIISDTFGRPWRNGQVNVAIGLAGLDPFLDYRGLPDNDGRKMKATQIAVADELASAAELISGKTNKQPVIIIRGYKFAPSAATAKDLVREEQLDLFK